MQDYLILIYNDSMTQSQDFLIRFPDKCKIMDNLQGSKIQRCLNIIRNQTYRYIQNTQKFLSISDSRKSLSFQDSQISHSTRVSQISLSTQGNQTPLNTHVNQIFLNILVNMIYPNKAVKLTLQQTFVPTKIAHPSLQTSDPLHLPVKSTIVHPNQQTILPYPHKLTNAWPIPPNQDSLNSLQISATKNK